MARLEAAFPGVPIADHQLLSEYDSSCFSPADARRRCPCCASGSRTRRGTWVYIDPETSQVLAQIHRWNRVERWFYNGLHSLDFAFWSDRRPLWDIGMIALCLGGLASSGIGLVMGVRRVRRATSRAAKLLIPAPAPEPREAAR